jgi:nuclear transport factor 2 (NTF2) superfamily protein
VALAYTEDSEWRNRDEFLNGRDEIRAFLRRKWDRELDYRLRKHLWAFTGDRIAVRFSTSHATATGNGGGRTATRCGNSTTPD